MLELVSKLFPKNQTKSTAPGAAQSAIAGRKRAEKSRGKEVRPRLLERFFAIDPRSLAVFRIFISALLLADLVTRVADLNAMYTDDGMFPRAEMHRRVTTVWNWSFHYVSGAAWFQGVLFGMAGVFALGLLLGFKTRVAAIGSWLMLVSVQHRVPAVLSGAEILLRMLVFWGMFLPLERMWSVDRWRTMRQTVPPAFMDNGPVLSVASAAILLQMGLMYLFSAIAKSNAQWWNGDAMAGILAHDFYASRPAGYLLGFPQLLKFLTWGTLALEWVAPFVLFFPKWTGGLRLATIGTLAVMHMGIGICLEVGLFSYVSLAGLCVFVPKEFWNNRVLARWFGSVREGQGMVAERGPQMARRRSRFFYPAQGLCLLALIYVLALNLDSFPGHLLAAFELENWRPFRTGLGLSQSWGMFGEIPSMDGWYVARAKLRDGSVVDLLRNGAALDWKRPDFPARLYPNHLWQKLFREMCYFDDQGFQVYRAPVATYLCRNWNGGHPAEKQVAEFEFIFCVADKEHAHGQPISSPRIYRRQLVRLDFTPGQEEPKVSGYTDAPPGAGVP